MVVLLSISLIACTPNLGASTTGWNPPVASEGVVYVGSTDGEVEALVDSGLEGVRSKWTYSGVGDSIKGVYNTPVVGTELLYVSAVDGFLYALNKETGTLGDSGWRRPQGEREGMRPLVTGPALDESLGIVVVGSEDHNLYAYDARTGEDLWQFTAGDKIWSTPTINQGTVYFGSHDKKVYAVDLVTGEKKWEKETGGAVVARPLVWNGMVIVGSFDRKLYAWDAENGEEAWSQPFEAGNWYWAGAVANNSTIFAPSMDGNVYALDRNGNLLWEHPMGSPIVSTPVLVPRGLVVASREGKISLLNTTAEDLGLEQEISALFIERAEVRAPLFTPPVGDPALSQAGIQASGDSQRESVYVGAKDGTVHRIEIKRGQNEIWCFDTEEDAVCN
ncbi:MAG TPA: PQQ-binding-like beta-propeller repeat protein [Dehalococcoidia bacterium]|nr:PQQ-binding-like beta-propeller repeat protein [Dehalococcoidia bacterium]